MTSNFLFFLRLHLFIFKYEGKEHNKFIMGDSVLQCQLLCNVWFEE